MIRSLLGVFWIACAGLIILLAVLLSLARVLLPYADDYRDDIARGLAGALGHEVTIGRVTAEWRGLGPRLMLRDLKVKAPEDHGGESRFERAELELDVLRSIARRTLYIRSMSVAGLRLTLVREPDGTIDVAGFDVAPRSGERDPSYRFPRWLLAQGHVAIVDAEIAWVDLSQPENERRDLRFTAVHLDVRSGRGRYQVDGRAMPPEAFGEQVRFSLDLKVPEDAPWQANVHVEGAGLHPAAWLEGWSAGGLRVTGGVAGARVWAQWQGGELRGFDGLLAASGLILGPGDDVSNASADSTETPAPEAAFDHVSARFAWRRSGAGWRLAIDRLQLDEATGDVAPDPGRITVAYGADGLPAGSLTARLDAIDLGKVLRVAAASSRSPAVLARAVGGLRPSGRLRDVALTLWREDESPRFTAEGRFEDVSGEPWQGAPGIAGIEGILRMDERSGTIELHTGEGEANFDALFREALPAARLHARVDWERDETGWRVRSPGLSFRNDDLALRAWGRMDWAPDDARPTVALFADFEAFSVERISRYLPAGIMHEGTVKWLDHAILSGTVPRGDLVLHGPLDRFPWDGRDGLFRVDFDVRDAALEYAAGWPRIERIDARVTFEGRRMDIAAARGRTLSAEIGPTRISIPRLGGGPAVLNVSGVASGPLADALAFLRDTPLANRFGTYVEDVVAKGSTALELGLEIPLGAGEASVQGALELKDSALELAGSTVELTAIDGVVRFSNDGITARDVRARVAGFPARIQVSTRDGQQGRSTFVDARGVAEAATVAGVLGIPAEWLGGAAEWQAALVVPDAAQVRATGLELRVNSSLEGLAIALPEPFSKPAGVALPMAAMARLPRTPQRPFTLSLGERMNLIIGFDAGLAVDRGELRFGPDRAVLPEAPGLRIAGRLESLSWDDWRPLLGSALAAEGGEPRGLPLKALDLEVARGALFGRELHDARVAAVVRDDYWSAQVSSREVAGTLEIPVRSGPPWRADLERLHLAAAPVREDGSSAAAPDPRELPALRLNSASFHYDGIDFGSLRLNASPRPAGMRLDELVLASDHTRVNARGDWVRVGDEQFSSFNIELDTENFARALSAFGYADTIRGGKGKSTISARWAGPPTAFALDRLHGSMELEVANGRLLDVEPGAGRVFGLISLQALPRRLTLDFSDFFSKGFSFDRITGSFAVRDGVASTSDLTMVGPAARVEARGDIDLAGRTYDQTVVVTPSVSSGLPVAGVVAGGVGVGAAMLLMERVFKDDIERIARLHYRVQGPWHDPLVERLQDGGQSGKR